jgi:hypothetical protein
MKAVQDFISGVLQPCIRLVQLAGCLASQLTELVAIGHMRKCPKYQIGTHYSLSFFICLPGRYYLVPAVQLGSNAKNRLSPKRSVLYN